MRFDPSYEPATTVYEAAAKARRTYTLLGDLLEHLADEMSDEHAREVEHPAHISSRRWLVVEDLGRGNNYDRWTAALALARAELGQPDPNSTPT